MYICIYIYILYICIYIYIYVYVYTIHILMNICIHKSIIKTHIDLPEPIGIETKSIQRGRQCQTRALRATHVIEKKKYTHAYIHICVYVYIHTYADEYMYA